MSLCSALETEAGGYTIVNKGDGSMAMMTEKGTLPFGIERDGKVHRDFEIRPALVKDTLEAYAEHGAIKLEDNAFGNVCLTSKRLLRIGDISPVTMDDMSGLMDEDYGEIVAAKERLAARLASFRRGGGIEGSEAAGPIVSTESKERSETGPCSGGEEVSSGVGS